MALTKTNTNTLCAPTKGHNTIILYLQRLKYRYYLWTGLYMLETHECIAFYVVVFPILIAFCIYCGVFIGGVLDGWKNV